MPETPTTPDLEKAHVILSEFGLLGIALGRKEALATARRSSGGKPSK